MASPFPEDLESRSPQPAADGASPAQASLFGTFRIVGADGAVLTPTGRKARALLACLLLADGEAVTRDRLTTLLWSKRGEDQARASLRQTLYEMRAPGSGGLAFLMLDRAQARIATAEVATDLDRLRSFPVDGAGAALAALIGQQPAALLSDLDGIDPAFDEWLAIERTRRHDERRRIVLDVSERSLAAADLDGAQRLAACLLAAEPTDEAAARLAMRASHRGGDRDGVRLVFARVEEALRADLGVDVSDETAELHRELMFRHAAPPPVTPSASHAGSAIAPRSIAPAAEAAYDQAACDQAAYDEANAAEKVGYPSIASEPTGLGTPLPAAIERSPDFAARPSWRPPPWLVGVSLLVLLSTLATWLRLEPPDRGARRTLFVESLQVLPGDGGATAMSTGLSTELARMILGHDRVLTVADVGGAGAPAPSGADFLIAGDAHSDAGVLYANVKIRRERGGTILWSSAFSRPVRELDALREQVATRVADVAICALGADNPKAADFQPRTLQLLLGACEQKHGDWNESARLLQQVVEQEPDFAHGWAMLAAATAVSALMVSSDTAALDAKAEHYAQQALALDPHEGEAFFARALARPGLTRWSERMAISEAGHALDPTNGQIDSQFAEDLANVGRWREATVYAQRAVDVDPFGMAKAAQRARLLGLGGDVPAAEVALRAAERRFQRQRMLVAADFRIQALAGDAARALAIVASGDAGFTLPPDRAATWKALLKARVEPSTANEDAAWRSSASDQQRRSTPTLRDVETLVHLRRVDQAFALAERLPSDAGDHENTDLLFAAGMQALRDDPRFMILAARLGLVAIWRKTARWPDFCSGRGLGYDCRIEAARALSADRKPLQPNG